MELTVYNIEGKDTGRKVNLNDEIYGIEPNDHAIYLDVKRHMANKRQGTHKAKERSEVRGSTRKIKKQKGTGSARAGSMKNPLFRGGGRVFGPRPRDYSFKLNKKVKKLARKSALTYKLKANELFVVEDFTFDAPKTKQYLAFEKNLKINDKKSILVLAEPNKNLYLSSRNLQGSKTITVSELTTYDILNTKALVLSESSVDVLEKTF
jgi:large subunit ribosomal protein L4